MWVTKYYLTMVLSYFMYMREMQIFIYYLTEKLFDNPTACSFYWSLLRFPLYNFRRAQRGGEGVI